MSWSIEFVGRNRAAVLQQLDLAAKASPGLSPEAVDALKAQIAAMNDHPQACIWLRSNGHIASEEASKWGPTDLSETTVRHLWFYDAPPAPVAEIEPEHADPAAAGPLHDAADPDALAAAIEARRGVSREANSEEEAPAES